MLYHFSEDPNIEIFVPREKQNRSDFPAVVWAIDKEHEFTYYFPRNCPRIALRRMIDISDENKEKFFGHSIADTVVVIESKWYPIIKDFTIFRYTFNKEEFEMFDKTAGYYISYNTVKPIEVIPIQNLLDRLVALNIEIRFTPNLHPLRNMILNSDYKEFGIHRFNNAISL